MTTTRTLSLLTGAVCALALGACGGGDDGGASAGGRDDDKAFAGALKFAGCMREHGIDVPDPKRSSGGGILIQAGKAGGGPSKDASGPGAGPDADPKFRAANDACKKYLVQGGGKAPSPSEQAAMRDKFLAYARCMRSKGINMPDPKFDGPGVRMTLGRGVRPDSPVYQEADRACHGLLGAAGGPSQVQGSAR